ncbi:MAG: hypothetical protein ABJD07_06010 [Gemmatimonadaceae bacterium]
MSARAHEPPMGAADPATSNGAGHHPIAHPESESGPGRVERRRPEIEKKQEG